MEDSIAEYSVARDETLDPVTLQFDRDDTCGIQAGEFTCIGLTILIEVSPDLELGKFSISGVESSAAIAIEESQSLQVSDGALDIIGKGDLVIVGDRTVIVFVIGQQPVIRSNPARPIKKPRSGDIEKSGRNLHIGEFKAVVVQIEDDRHSKNFQRIDKRVWIEGTGTGRHTAWKWIFLTFILVSP